MKIILNNESRDIKDSTSLYSLIQELGVKTGGIAMAVNGEVIQKEDWENTILNEKDNVMLIRATQGG